MRNLSLVVVGLAAVTFVAPAFAHSHNHARHAPFATVGAPQFVRVDPQGYWITTTWSCYTDDGQGRIQDCEGGSGGGGS
jgi:hypothetical protein